MIFLLCQIILISILFVSSSSQLNVWKLSDCISEMRSRLIPFLGLTELCGMYLKTRQGYCEILVVEITRNLGRAREICETARRFLVVLLEEIICALREMETSTVFNDEVLQFSATPSMR